MSEFQESPFTIIDGVPRAILATALENAVRSELSSAQSALKRAAQTIADACNVSNRWPDSDMIDRAVSEFAAARLEWARVVDTGNTVLATVRELRGEGAAE